MLSLPKIESMAENSPASNRNNFDKEANAAALRAARPGKQVWYNFRPDLLSYPRESSKGAAVVDAIIESFCRRNLTFTVANIEACQRNVPPEFKRGGIGGQIRDLVNDEYIRKCQSGYERVPPELLDEFSGRGNGGNARRRSIQKPRIPTPDSIPVQPSTNDSVLEESPAPSEQMNAAATARLLNSVEQQLVSKDAFDPSNVKDARTRTMAAIVRRRGQPAFRQALITAYNGRCAITECDVVDVLEAAHITPYKGDETNCVGNGLLLRADVHTLFDLRLIAIDESTMRVLVSTELDGTYFEAFRGKEIIIPDDPDLRPIQAALKRHREECRLRG